MIILTGRGALAAAIMNCCPAEVVSARELSDSSFEKRLAEATVVIHNAASIKCGSFNDCLAANFDFTRSIVNKLLKSNPLVHLIYISSMSILDRSDANHYAAKDQMDGYAYSKFLGETYCLESALSHVTCVRFSTLFYRNPARDGLSRLIADAVRCRSVTIFNRGESVRDFLPISIAAEYLAKLAARTPSEKRCLNLASGVQTSFALAATWLKTAIPDLRVEEQSAPFPAPVLASFSTKDADSIGAISFSLKDDVLDYIKVLSASSNALAK